MDALEEMDQESIEEIQAWIDEEPSRYDFIVNTYWLAFRRGANWAIAAAVREPVPPQPFVRPGTALFTTAHGTPLV